MTAATIRIGRAALAVALVVLLAEVPRPAAGREGDFSVAGADLVSVTLDEANRLSLRVRDAADIARHDAGDEPQSLLLHAKPAPAGGVPDGKAFGFLGAAGHPIWTLTHPGGVFPAWDATGVPAARLADGNAAVRLGLAGVDGPGVFTAYTLSPVGRPTLLLGSAGEAPRTLALAAGARHGGAIWAFDTPGSYTVTFTAAVTLRSGAVSETGATYRVEVPDSVAVPMPGKAQPAASPPHPSPVAPSTFKPPAAAAAPLAAYVAAAPSTGRVVAADGHIDIGPRFVDGAWIIQIRDDRSSPPLWRNVPDVVLHAVDPSKIQVPGGSEYAFLGSPGTDVWLMPQVQQSGILWPGWNTQDPSVVSGVSGSVAWTLRGVEGPGRFVLFLTGSFGQPQVLFHSGQSLPQQMSVPPNTHAHGNWAFTKPGVYRLSIHMSGTTTGGQQVTDTKTLAIAVGAVDPNSAFPSGAGPLPRTGTNIVLPLTAGGAALLLAGAALLVITRRRRGKRQVPTPADPQ